MHGTWPRAYRTPSPAEEEACAALDTAVCESEVESAACDQSGSDPALAVPESCIP